MRFYLGTPVSLYQRRKMLFLSAMRPFGKFKLKIKLSANLQDIIQQLPENNFQQLPIHANHLLTLGKLPPHHQDPFDRMLIAQAIHEPMHLLTHDKQLSNYSELVILI
jgi:PIN domain nuclease of toxin-antitoxin system